MGILLQAFEADRHQVSGKTALELAGGKGLMARDLLERRKGCSPFEWRTAGNHLIEDGPQRIDVCGRSDLVRESANLFGCHVAGRAQDLAGARQGVLALEQLRQSEVRDLGDALFGEQDVRRFQVPMDDPAQMGIVDRSSQEFDEAGRFHGVLKRAGQASIQSSAGGVFEHEVSHALVFPDLEDRDQVGVLEPGRCLGLRLEARRGSRVSIGIGANDLQRHDPLEPDLPGLVDRTHPTTSQLAQNPVARPEEVSASVGTNFFRFRHVDILGNSVPRWLDLAIDPQHVVEVELSLEPFGEPREAPSELSQGRPLAPLLAQQELTINQFECRFAFIPDRWMHRQIRLGRDPLAVAPSLHLVIAEAL